VGIPTQQQIVFLDYSCDTVSCVRHCQLCSVYRKCSVLSNVSIVLYSIMCYCLVASIWREARFSYTCKVTVLDYFVYVTVIVVHIIVRDVHAMICGCYVRAGYEPVQLHLLWVRGNVRFAHGTRYATICVRLLWLTPSHGTSIMTVCTGVSCLLQT